MAWNGTVSSGREWSFSIEKKTSSSRKWEENVRTGIFLHELHLKRRRTVSHSVNGLINSIGNCFSPLRKTYSRAGYGRTIGYLIIYQTTAERNIFFSLQKQNARWFWRVFEKRWTKQWSPHHFNCGFFSDRIQRCMSAAEWATILSNSGIKWILINGTSSKNLNGVARHNLEAPMNFIYCIELKIHFIASSSKNS